MRIIWITIALQLITFLSFASPHPAMGSSILLSLNKGYMFAIKKFTLNSADTKWQIENNNEEESINKEKYEISVRFKGVAPSGSLLVQSKTLLEAMSLESYAKTWIRDYSAYGFDVLGTREFLQNNAKGFVVDLIHRKMNKQIRQVVFLRKKTSVTLTCTDNKDQFKETLNSCNAILKTFEWL